jgi:HEAT repeats
MTIFGEAGGEVTAQFDDLPLQQGLSRLLAPRSFVLVCMEEGTAPPPGGRLRLVPVASDRTTLRAEGLGQQDTRALHPASAGTPPPDAALLAAVGAGGRGATVAARTRFLKGVVATEPDAGIRSVALKTLTAIGPISLDEIVQAVLVDPSAEVRRLALELLVIHGKQDGLVMNTLLTVARTDPDAGVREQAMVYAKNLTPALPGGADPLRGRP